MRRRNWGTKIFAILGIIVIISMLLSLILLPSLPSP
jgi:hypothetical protein